MSAERKGELHDRQQVGGVGPQGRPNRKAGDAATSYTSPQRDSLVVDSQVTSGKQAVVMVDQADWYLSNALAVPSNDTLLPIPSKCAELNAQTFGRPYVRCPRGGRSPTLLAAVMPAREAAALDLREKRRHLQSFSQRHERIHADRRPRTKVHARWLSSLTFSHPAQYLVLREYRKFIDDTEARLERVTD